MSKNPWASLLARLWAGLTPAAQPCAKVWGQAQVRSPNLTVPHLRWLQRAFVLSPLAELAPERLPTEALAAAADQVMSQWAPPPALRA